MNSFSHHPVYRKKVIALPSAPECPVNASVPPAGTQGQQRQAPSLSDRRACLFLAAAEHLRSVRAEILTDRQATMLLAAALVALPTFIPAEPAQAADDLFISGGGGGGGGSSLGATGGAGGRHAGDGYQITGGNPNGGGGGGAYVGNGTDQNYPLPHTDADGVNNAAGKGYRFDAQDPSLDGAPGGTVPLGNQRGGAGGAASLVITGDLLYDNIYIEAGGGGGARNSAGNNQSGAAGGDASLDVTGTLKAGMSFSMTSGENGQGGSYGGAGGAVSLKAGTLIAPKITLTKQNGDLTVDVGTLDVTQNNTEMTLDGTAAGDGTTGVRYRIIDIAGGRTLKVNRSNNGTYSFETLNVRGEHGNPAIYDGNLDAADKNLNFYLGPDVEKDDIMLAVTGKAKIGGSTVNAGIDGASSPLQAGDEVVLMEATGGLEGQPKNSATSGIPGGTFKQGSTLLYDFDISTEGNKLLATLTTPTGSPLLPQTKALPEGFISSAAMLNQGADTLAGQGIADAVRAAKINGVTREGFGLAGFGAIGGGRLRYNTGSHVDVSGFSLLAGLSLGRDLTPGRLTLGAFFEYGQGDYDTYNSFSNAASAHGGGDTSYIGGGILGHFNFINTGPGHFYAEATVRMGRTESDFSSSDLRDISGRKAAYDSESLYYGLHFGAGYVWNITDSASLDLYGKYFWTRQEGDSVTLSTGEPLHFDAVDSHRARFGGRFAYAVNDFISPYIGAAYEHEFDGEAKAKIHSFRIDAPTLQGSTGIGELGITVAPVAVIPLSIDLGVQGYTGTREGVTGSLQLKLEF